MLTASLASQCPVIQASRRRQRERMCSQLLLRVFMEGQIEVLLLAECFYVRQNVFNRFFNLIIS